MTFFLAKEYENGSCKMYHLSEGKAEDVEGAEVHQGESLCFNFEVTAEMRGRPSSFSLSPSRPACGTNFVLQSYIPPQVFRGRPRRIEGLQKVRKEFLNGFLVSGRNVRCNSLILDNVTWQVQLQQVQTGPDFFTFIFLHKKAGADLRLIVESQLVRRLPDTGHCIVNCCSQRFSTSFQGGRPRSSAYTRPQPAEEMRFTNLSRKVLLSAPSRHQFKRKTTYTLNFTFQTKLASQN